MLSIFVVFESTAARKSALRSWSILEVTCRCPNSSHRCDRRRVAACTASLISIRE